MKHRLAVILPAYFVLFGTCLYSALLLRFDFDLPDAFLEQFWTALPFVMGVKLLVCWLTGEWKRTFRYTTLEDVLHLSVGATLAAVLLFGLNATCLSAVPIPRSVIVIDWTLVILASGLLRSGIRLYLEMFRPLLRRERKERAVVYRPDHTDQNGLGILRALGSNGSYRIVGFVDGSKTQRHSLLAGLPVLSTQIGWRKLKKTLGIKHVLIPSTVPGRKVRAIVESCAEAGLQSHVIPQVDEIVAGRLEVKVRDVTISDLLRREPAQLDMAGIRDYVAGRRVMVTGGAGSIGSELCRQILSFAPASLVLVDQSEFGMFTIEQEFALRHGNRDDIHFAIADVCDEDAMYQIMDQHQPELVFHAAAYKHVPLMEDNPQEAIRNNIMGTKTVIDLADQFGVRDFVLISTDKAVRPSSVMGATKFLAEKYLQGKSTTSDTKMITVRFGNVLNSAGSVVPTFRRQIESGGPITVTHPDIERFFMTIPEAVQLVLQGGAAGSSGDVLILEMGQPVKIVDLAKDMIFLSGLRYPDDIDIEFTGLRPGEKLSEELFYESEQGARKIRDKIYCSAREYTPFIEVNSNVAHLENAARTGKQAAAIALWDVVSQYVAEDAAPVLELKSAA